MGFKKLLLAYIRIKYVPSLLFLKKPQDGAGRMAQQLRARVSLQGTQV